MGFLLVRWMHGLAGCMIEPLRKGARKRLMVFVVESKEDSLGFLSVVVHEVGLVSWCGWGWELDDVHVLAGVDVVALLSEAREELIQYDT